MIALTADLIQKALNRLISLDPEHRRILQPLVGRLIGIDVTGLDFILIVSIDEDGVRLIDTSCEVPDVWLRGTPAALLSLLRSPAGPEMSREGISVSGDLGVLEALETALGQLTLDWEEPLAQIFGDPVAAGISGGLRRLDETFRRIGSAVAENVIEYVRDESGWLADRDDIERFVTDIDKLRDDVSRFEKRLDRYIANQERRRGGELAEPSSPSFEPKDDRRTPSS